MYLNRLTLIGFIGGDAETKTISNGSTFTALSVATQRSWKNSEGAWESRTEWHRCVSFGRLADFAATLKKGAHVQVEGELRSREHEKGESVEVHSLFSCSARVSWGTQEREAAAPKSRSCFSGGTRMGEPEPERRRQAKQRLRRPPGAGIGPKLCPGPKGRSGKRMGRRQLIGSDGGIGRKQVGR